jgi:serine/threonine-protein kinase
VYYMSPEQAAGDPVDGRSDLYSLGAVAYQMFTGSPPFEAEAPMAVLAMHQSASAPSIREQNRHLPSQLGNAIDCCLAKSPAARFESAEAFADAIRDAFSRDVTVPAALRIWVKSSVHIWVLWVIAAFGFAGLVSEISQPDDWGPWLLLGPTTLGVAVLSRVRHARRVLREGYGLRDMQRALETVALTENEEAKAESANRSLLQHTVDVAVFLASVLILFTGLRTPSLRMRGLVELARQADPERAARISDLAANMFMVQLLFLIVGYAGLSYLYSRTGLRRIPLRLRSAYWHTPPAAWFLRLASLGIRSAASRQPSWALPTVLAIGSAINDLFRDLPRKHRSELQSIPQLARQLTSDAHELRARAHHLSALLAQVRPPLQDSIRDLPRSAGANVHDDDQHRILAAELHTNRDEALDRLASVTHALERIRLSLLRLQAGIGTVDQVRAELQATSGVAGIANAGKSGEPLVVSLISHRRP